MIEGADLLKLRILPPKTLPPRIGRGDLSARLSFSDTPGTLAVPFAGIPAESEPLRSASRPGGSGLPVSNVYLRIVAGLKVRPSDILAVISEEARRPELLSSLLGCLAVRLTPLPSCD